MIKKLFLAVLLLFTFFVIGCAQQTNQQQRYDTKADFGQEFNLKVSQTALIHTEKISSKDIFIKFLNVTEDSRCPIDVYCIWRGVAIIRISVMEDSNNLGEFDVSDFDQMRYNSTAKIREYYVTLLDISPLPTSSLEIKNSDYVATLVVKV